MRLSLHEHETNHDFSPNKKYGVVRKGDIQKM